MKLSTTSNALLAGRTSWSRLLNLEGCTATRIVGARYSTTTVVHARRGLSELVRLKRGYVAILCTGTHGVVCCGGDDVSHKQHTQAAHPTASIFPRHHHHSTADNSKRQRLKYKRFEVTPRSPVPATIPKPNYVGSTRLPDWIEEPQVHDSEGIERMRAAGKLAAEVLEYAGTLIKV